MCHVASFPNPKPGHSESSEAATVNLSRKTVGVIYSDWIDFEKLTWPVKKDLGQFHVRYHLEL